MQLTWLGAAGFKVDTSEGATFLIDPFLSRPEKAHPPLPLKLDDLFPVDEIFLTNGRFDHSMDVPALVRQTGAIVHAPASICDRLAQLGVSPHSLQPITLNKTKSLGSLMWQAVPGLVNQAESSLVLHTMLRQPHLLDQVSALDRQWPLDEIVAYFFQADGLLLAHFGNAGWLESEIEQFQPDIALVPVESNAGSDAAAVALTARLAPRLVVPHHWDDYYPPVSRAIDLSAFETAVKQAVAGVEVFVPTIGRRFNPAAMLT